MNRTRWLATAAAGLAAVLGGGAALAASGSSDSPSDFIGDVAQRLGISKDKLENAIDDATIARIDAAVADGKLTKEQGEELKKRVRSGDGPVILPGFGGPDFRGPELGIGPPGIGPPGIGLREKGFFGGFDLMQKAADYLGVDLADLRKELSDGKSLADVAKDKGKSVDGLEQTLRDAIRADADKAVEDGKLTKEQADRIVEKLSATVDELVEHGGGPILRFHERGRLMGPIGPPPGKGFPGFFGGFDFMEKAADYLGMDPSDLRKELSDGKSLADVAEDKGESVDGLEQSLRDAIRADADKAVDDGKLTKEQADRLVKGLSAGVDDLVEGGRFEFHFRTGPGRLPPPGDASFAPA
jgi:polyhydroxyalkanoate synthesis regulator phasin